MSEIVIEKTSSVFSPSPVFAPFHITYQESENMSSAASSACHGLQSCLEPLILDPTVLMHKLLVPSKQALSSSLVPPHTQPEFPLAKCSKQYYCSINKICVANRNGEESTDHWSSFQSLTNHRNPTDDEAGQIYVHPLVKRAGSSLSSRSLEMCTESLGSETGSNVIESTAIDEFSPEEEEKQQRPACRARTPKRGGGGGDSCKKDDAKRGSNFPPPLTSISGSDGGVVGVRTHREGGRLVIRAFTFSISGPCFQAERKNGRLRLSLVKDVGLDSVDEKDGDKERDENVDESGDENEINGGFWEGKDGGKIECNKMGGGGGGAGGSNRCNGDRSGNQRLPSLPFWVAIS